MNNKGIGTKKKMGDKAKPKNKAEDKPKVCEFCGRTDRNF